jgi:hypothetical protein
MKIRLVKQKLCYRLTFTGWVLILVPNIFLFLFITKYISSYLIVDEPLQSEILIVDGLMPGYGYDSIANLVRRESYKYLITTGADVDYVYNSGEHFNIAEFSYKVLSTKDIGACKLFKAPAKYAERDRTFASAVCLKDWFIANNIFPWKINVISFSCHARRTWILYKKAFSQYAEVGIITIPDISYNYRRWYNSSKGVRLVLSETIGYVYSLIFFYPNIRDYENSN